MKLIKQISLYYQEGKSDKVYEVDLCEVGADKFVVNFRYGRKDANLKDGTKTVLPVAQDKAEKIFNDLVNSKTKKGYKVSGAAEEAVPPPPPPADLEIPESADPRIQAIINRLTGRELAGKQAWPLERVIWRAGELKIREVEPLLSNLIGTGTDLRDYSIIWALGRCGTPNEGTTIQLIETLLKDRKTSEKIRRICTEAFIKLFSESKVQDFKTKLINQLPSPIKESIKTNPEQLLQDLDAFLIDKPYQNYQVLYTLYLIDNKISRPALIELLHTAPLKPNYFKQIRHIFKAAEYRGDSEMFALLAYRFETSRAMFQSDSYYVNVQNDQGYYDYVDMDDVKKSMQKPDSKYAYSSGTRWYLRRRVWRTLRRMGELNDPDYVKMAVGILTSYTDDDAGKTLKTSHYRYIQQQGQWRSVETVTWYDAYANYWAFNHILYKNSSRYYCSGRTWKCKDDYKPGDPEPEVREEAFSELWSKNPAAVLFLLCQSRCKPVHHFGVKILRNCDAFLDTITIDSVIMLLDCPYEITAELGFELAQKIYKPDGSRINLVKAVVNCFFAPARQQAFKWIEERRDDFLQDRDFLFTLMSSINKDVRQFARTLLASSPISTEISQALFGRAIAHMLSLASDLAEQAKDLAELLLKFFVKECRSLGMPVIIDLINHPLQEVQQFGGDILLGHDIYANNPPDKIIQTLLSSSFNVIRGLGVKLFGQLPEDTLVQRQDVLISFITHQLEDMRNAIRPVLSKLISTQPAFVRDFTPQLITKLMTLEDEDVQNYVVKVIKEDFKQVSTVPINTIWALIHTKATAIQELGGIFLKNSEEADSLKVDQIIDLADHEVRAIRESAWSLSSKHIHRFKENMNYTIRLLDAKWDDSRAFAFELFRNQFTEEDFTPTSLVSVCDSVREDVQIFGRELITKYFQKSHGHEYLIKLSEHPSLNVQVFVTNLLEEYAAGNVDRIKDLAFYFKQVLCRVNKGRVAKDRIFIFLANEAQKNLEAAKVIAEILTFVSATVAIGDKSAAIKLMVKLRQRYPEIDLPISLVTPLRK